MEATPHTATPSDSSPSSHRFACTADRIFDGHQVLADHAVIVESGNVSRTVPLAEVPADIPLHQFRGCTIIPGLLDIHVHFMRWQGPCFLAHGVTTIRDTGNRLDWILDRRREYMNHPWPRILCQGPLLDGPTPYHPLVSRRNENVDAAVASVRETLAAGADDIKLYVGIPPSWVEPMMRECHALGHKAAMEVGAGGLLSAARSGMDELFHYDGLLDDIWPGHPPGWISLWGDPRFEAATRENQLRAADEIQRLGAAMTPTLAYCEGQARIRSSARDSLAPAAHQAPGGAYSSRNPEQSPVPGIMRQWQSARPDPAAATLWRNALHAAQRFTSLLLEREVPIFAGTDVPFGAITPGLCLWHELGFLTGAGMTPLQALCAATSAAADFLRRPELGRLSPGAAADLVVVRGNPLQAIPDQPEIHRVMRAGVWHDPALLLQQIERLDSPSQSVAEAASMPPDPWATQLEQHFARTR